MTLTGVSLVSQSPAVTVPSATAIQPGESTAVFSADVAMINANEVASISASAGGNTLSVSLSLVAAADAPQVSAVACAPSVLAVNETAECTVDLSRPPGTPVNVAISQTSSVLIGPASVTVNGGTTRTRFEVRGGVTASDSEVTLTVSLSNSRARQAMTVKGAAAPRIVSPRHVGASASFPVQFEIRATDPQGLPVDLKVSGLPQGAAFDSTAGRVNWTPSAAQTGDFTVKITATNTAGVISAQDILIRVLKDKAAVHTARNAANLFSNDFCSAGAWASLFGVAFTTQDPIVAESVPLPASLGSVEVRVNNQPVPHLFVSETQINFQCPMLPEGSSIKVTVKAETGVTTTVYSGVMSRATPSLFTLDSSGEGQGIVLIANSNELAMPVTEGIPGRPALPGEHLSIFANGLGDVEEVIPAGLPTPLDHLVMLKNEVRVFLDGVQVAHSFAGLSPGTVRIYQINVPVTDGMPAGPAVPLHVELVLGDGSVLASNVVTVAIGQALPD
jgi:uncharacterized protein (TIGR03437 family)